MWVKNVFKQLCSYQHVVRTPDPGLAANLCDDMTLHGHIITLVYHITYKNNSTSIQSTWRKTDELEYWQNNVQNKKSHWTLPDLLPCCSPLFTFLIYVALMTPSMRSHHDGITRHPPDGVKAPQKIFLSCRMTNVFLLISSGPPSWNHPLLFRPADWWRLCGSAGGGIPLGHSTVGAGIGCILSPGPAPPAWPVLHPIQPSCVQEPAGCAAQGPWHWLLWQARWSWWRGEGKGLGLR